MFARADCPRFTVNLDDPPATRWDHILPRFRDDIPGVLTMIDDMVDSPFAIKLIESCLKTAVFFGSVMYSEELTRIAELLGVPVGKVILLQLAYEAFAACTSVVATGDAADGHPLHIRTMDWEMPELERLTIEVDFQRSGRTVASATTWAGYVGVVTGLRVGAFSLSVNYRRTELMSEKPVAAFMKNLWGVVRSKWPVSYVLREVLTQEAPLTYSGVLRFFRGVHLVAPCYITVAGTAPGEGCVCSMERKGKKSTFVEMPHDRGSDSDSDLPRLHLTDVFSVYDAPSEVSKKKKKKKTKKKKMMNNKASTPDEHGQQQQQQQPAGPAAVSVAEAEDRGFIVQTNMDWWRDDDAARTGNPEPHEWQDICDSRLRRLFARSALRQCQEERDSSSGEAPAGEASGGGGGGGGGGAGAGPVPRPSGPCVSETDLWTVMSTPPCLAHDTVYTTFMDPSSGKLVTRVKARREHVARGTRRFGALQRRIQQHFADETRASTQAATRQ